MNGRAIDREGRGDVIWKRLCLMHTSRSYSRLEKFNQTDLIIFQALHRCKRLDVYKLSNQYPENYDGLPRLDENLQRNLASCL